ncbi:MAG: tRNA (adenine-N(6)-)-methyltransferase [Flavobacteriaceae bacterium]|nr:MAG: tRNA (adenine-N(6)-)-methyltransferase [Flavobacteriaceae bacterium]
MNKPFKFKQFRVQQDKCAMKIGTDGVLLGAWASLDHNPNSILDIGAGTGVIALMLAQRSVAEMIEAIEIDANAYEQCVGNFEESAWADRLFCFHAGLDEFVNEIEEKYELIISNPPFYSEKISSGDTARDIARQNQSLPFDELLEGVAILLSKKGTFSTIIPYKEEASFIQLAQTFGLFPQRICNVKGTPSSEIKRSLLEFGFKAVTPALDVLTIELERHKYTSEYKALTQEFYLKM